MKRLLSSSLLALAAVALAAAGPSVKEEMKAVVEPASNVLFAVGGEVDPSNGPPPPTVADSRWKEAADAAAKLKSVAGAMMQTDQIKPGDDWGRAAKQLADLADQASAAAKTKDGAKLAQVANDLGDNCTACHSKYKPQTAS